MVINSNIPRCRIATFVFRLPSFVFHSIAEPNAFKPNIAARLGQPAINLLPAALFAGAPAGARTVGARTEHLTIARGGGDVQATVKRIEHLGDQSHLHLDLGGQPVVTLSDPEARLGAGDIVSLRLNKPLFFDADGGRVAA